MGVDHGSGGYCLVELEVNVEGWRGGFGLDRGYRMKGSVLSIG